MSGFSSIYIPALPFCQIQFCVKKPLLSYPKQLDTLGDHMRARRLELKLLQKNVAVIIGVSEETINHWEMKRREPEVQLYPKIMDFLGYCPVHYAHSFGDLLRLHRTHRGLSHRQLGKILGFDPASLSRWENEERKPLERCEKRIIEFLGM